MNTELVKISPYSSIPDWLSGEVEDLLGLTKSLINSISNKKGPNSNNDTYNEGLWNTITSIIKRLFISKTINSTERNRMMTHFSERASGEDAINFPFYFLEELYYSGYLIPDIPLLLETRDVLIQFAKETKQIGEISQIEIYAERHSPSQESFDYASHISQYTSELIEIIKSKTTSEEADYIQTFSDFLFAEGILDWNKHTDIIEANSSIEMIHDILLELLLGNFYENNENMMIQVAQLLIIYYQGNKKEEYVLNYISQYSDDILNYTIIPLPHNSSPS